MSAPSLAAARDKLFDLYILPPRDQQADPLERLREHVREAYRVQPTIAPLLQATPQLETTLAVRPLDFAVVRGDIAHELTTSFSFARDVDQRATDRLDAWNYSVHDLRRSGARLLLPDAGRSITIDRDTAVAVTFVPPRSDRQHERLEKATAVWRTLDIDTFPADEVQAHAQALATSIAAAA